MRNFISKRYLFVDFFLLREKLCANETYLSKYTHLSFQVYFVEESCSPYEFGIKSLLKFYVKWVTNQKYEIEQFNIEVNETTTKQIDLFTWRKMSLK